MTIRTKSFHLCPLPTRRIVPLTFFIAITFVVLELVAYSHTSGTATIFRPECPRTEIYPFDTGCPHDCASLRPSLRDETFYLSSAYWKFGELAAFRDVDRVIPSLAAHFLRTETELKVSVQKRVSDLGLPPLKIRPQRKIHVSLSYFCCLTEAEAPIVKDTIVQWSAAARVPGPVSFSHVHCFHERLNSVTVIWDLDEEAQRSIMQMNHELRDQIEQAGVRVWIARENQMPFHTTLVGFQVDKGESIAPYLKPICAGVNDVGDVQAHANITFGVIPGGTSISQGPA